MTQPLTWRLLGSLDLAEFFDLKDADEERANELSAVFAAVAWSMYDEDDEEIDDIVYAMVLVISMIMAHKQADDATKH